MEEAHHRGAERYAASVNINLAEQLCATRGPAAAAEICRQTVEWAQRRHDGSSASAASADLAFNLLWCGAWDEALELTEALEPLLEQRRLEVLGFVRASSALLRLLRGRLDEAELLAEAAEAFCRPLKRFETRSVSLLALAIVEMNGDFVQAR